MGHLHYCVFGVFDGLGAVTFDLFMNTAEHLDAAIWVVRYPPSLGHQIYVAQLVGIGCSTT